jgi:hypothetical protein
MPAISDPGSIERLSRRLPPPLPSPPRGGSRRSVRRALAAAVGAACFLTGCGSTLTSNTPRTATEQLLISDAIDRTVEAIDFSPLRGETVFFDDAKLGEVTDKAYLLSSLRQHLLASGCVLKPTREEATYVVEARAGAIGTDSYDVLFGVPALQMPQVAVVPALPAAIPEIPLAKRREQRGVAKVAVFAYRRDTGEPVWQSGTAKDESNAKNLWVFGAGPFRRGTIYGEPPTRDNRRKRRAEAPDEGALVAGLGDEAVFPGLRDGEEAQPPDDGRVMQATATEAVDGGDQFAEPTTTDVAPDGLPAARPISEAPPR